MLNNSESNQENQKKRQSKVKALKWGKALAFDCNLLVTNVLRGIQISFPYQDVNEFISNWDSQ